MFVLNYLLIYYVSAWTYKNIELRFNHLPQLKPSKLWRPGRQAGMLAYIIPVLEKGE